MLQPKNMVVPRQILVGCSKQAATWWQPCFWNSYTNQPAQGDACLLLYLLLFSSAFSFYCWKNFNKSSLAGQPLLPRVDHLQYLTAGRRVWALTHSFRVNTTRDLGSSNCPIRFKNMLTISRDRNRAVRRLTALEESATCPVYKLCPKQTEAVLAFVRGYDVSVSPPKGTRSAENTYKYELGRARRDNSGIFYCACR